MGEPSGRSNVCDSLTIPERTAPGRVEFAPATQRAGFRLLRSEVTRNPRNALKDKLSESFVRCSPRRSPEQLDPEASRPSTTALLQLASSPITPSVTPEETMTPEEVAALGPALAAYLR